MTLDALVLLVRIHRSRWICVKEPIGYADVFDGFDALDVLIEAGLVEHDEDRDYARITARGDTAIARLLGLELSDP